MTLEIEDNNLIIRDDTGLSTHVIPLEAIASWRELLGLSSDMETVAAIMQATDPGILDPDTGRNAWTSAYEQCERERLLDLNQESKAALHRAFTLRGGLTSDGRALTRQLLGLPGGNVAQIRLMDDIGQTPAQSIPLPDGLDQTELDDVLQSPQVADHIQQARDKFNHDIIHNLIRKK